MHNKFVKIGLIGILFLALIAIRFYEGYFYDPLQAYFKYDYLHASLPEIDNLKLLVHLFLRYTLNSLLSILIIWVAFLKKSYVQFAFLFYILAFIVLLIAFWVTLLSHFENYYLFGFYVRRFLIQPLFVLILLPAFYYQYKLSAR